MAWFDQRGDFYIFVRLIMLALGAVITGTALMLAEPAEIILTLTACTLVFWPGIFEMRAAWVVLNPAISIIYLSHASWIGLRAVGLV